MDNRDGIDAPSKGLPRSQSERLLAVCKDHVLQERELQEKYHESMFSTVEKVMKVSQSNQLKTLQSIYERETADVKRKLQAMRHEEVHFENHISLIRKLYVVYCKTDFSFLFKGKAVGKGSQR